MGEEWVKNYEIGIRVELDQTVVANLTVLIVSHRGSIPGLFKDRLLKHCDKILTVISLE